MEFPFTRLFLFFYFLPFLSLNIFSQPSLLPSTDLSLLTPPPLFNDVSHTLLSSESVRTISSRDIFPMVCGWKTKSQFDIHLRLNRGTQWYSWLAHCVTGRKVAISIPDEVTGFSNDLIILAAFWPEVIQPLTGTGTRSLSAGGGGEIGG
jgi:hypothetical protein